MRKFSALVCVVVFAATMSSAEGTRTWEQSSFEDFEKGTTNGVAISSDGALELAPSFKPLSTTPSTYIWAMDTDSAGTIYAAAGSPARVYRITPTGQSSVIFTPKELQVQALVVGPNDMIYAATSPDGKVYKIEHNKAGTENATQAEKPASSPTPQIPVNPPASAPPVDTSYVSSVLFNPGTKYIWDLVLDKQENLYVATGDRGEIFKISKTGEHSLFFKSDEAHIRVLAFDQKSNLLAGSDGSGLVYRISPAGEAFVLYSAPKKEITALAVDDKGNIYAAGVGEKRAQPVGSAPQVPVLTPPSTPIIPAQLGTTTVPAPMYAITTFAATGGSEIYRIAPDGSPLRIWNSRDDLVYALGFDQRGTLLAGTGNKGRIFAVTGNDEFTDLLKASANLVTAFAKAQHGGLYASTSNFGKVFVLGPQAQNDGSYESDVFDARIFSRWGRAEVRSTGTIDFYARSGNVDNPDRNWSPWEKIDLSRGGSVGVPSARFVQWKAVLHDHSPAPHLESVLMNYLPKNVAPSVDDVVVQVGTRYQPALKMVPAEGNAGIPQQTRVDAIPPSVHDRDSIAVRWSTHDDNDDQLLYSLYYRGDGDSRWLLLKDDIDDRFYSFDASLLPDGDYNLKVVASDAPSHSPNEALTSEKESPRFEVDTTPPAIQELRAAMQSPQLHVTFRAFDGFSPIKRAEYSVDAGDWQYVEPVDQISDGKTENYDFVVPVPGGDSQEHIIVVRAYDRFENMGASKFVVHVRSKAGQGGKK
jgi:hypothetical protein